MSNSLPLGKAHQLVTQYQRVSPEDMNTRNITQTKLVTVIFRYTYLHITSILRKEWVKLKESKSGNGKVLKGRKGR